MSDNAVKQFLSSDHDHDDADSDKTYFEEETDTCKVTKEIKGTAIVPSISVQKVDLLTPATCKNAPKVTVAELSPLPHVSEKKKRNKRSLKSEIITSTPYKNQLEEKKMIEDEKSLKKYMKKINFNDPTANINEKQKLKRLSIEPQPGPSGLKTRKIKSEKVTKKQSKTQKTKKEFKCPICGDAYKDPPDEEWIQCFVCKRWYHEDCTAYEKLGKFFCDFCND